MACTAFILVQSVLWAADGTVTDQTPLARIFAGGEPQSLADLKAMERHQQTLTKRITACTVGIVVGAAHGSGVIVSEDGYVLTAAHVAGRANRAAEFYLTDGRRVAGITLGLHRTLDVGLMKITGDGPWPHAEMAKAGQHRVGQWCAVTGHPGGFRKDRPPVVRIGRILLQDKFAITTDCPLVGGDSGGPLFDMSGQVIGINSRIGSFLTANMHAPIEAYHEVWDRLVAGEAWGSFPGTGPYIGVRGVAESSSAEISSVFPDSPAFHAGIQVGDVVRRFNGRPVSDFGSLQLLVSDCRPGDSVKVQVEREGQLHNLTLVVGRRSP